MMKVKLYIDRNSNKVLYAEAGKDFVEFLLHTFMMPLGYAMKNVFNGAVTGGLATLYTSAAEDLTADYLVAGSKTKASFTNPNVIKTFYHCVNCYKSVSDVKGTRCSCSSTLLSLCPYCAPLTEYKVEIGTGHVKGMMTYMITDELKIKPLSSSTVTMNHLSQLSIKDFSCIQETEVTDDTNQCCAGNGVDQGVLTFQDRSHRHIPSAQERKLEEVTKTVGCADDILEIAEKSKP